MIDVWRIAVPSAGDLAGLLSRDEVERAERFHFERDRRAFVTTRGVLRVLAGSYLGTAPDAVAFSYGSRGKPEIEGLAFNVSHAGDVALVAFGPGRIGVDVEEMRPDVEMHALARRFFTPSENKALSELLGDDLVRAFYGCWTTKEAFVKAMGEGLSFELDRVDVSVWPDAPAVVSVDGDVEAGARWTTTAVDVARGYVATVVSDVPNVEVLVRDWHVSVAA